MNRNSCSKSCVVSLISSKQMQWLCSGKCISPLPGEMRIHLSLQFVSQEQTVAAAEGRV